MPPSSMLQQISGSTYAVMRFKLMSGSQLKASTTAAPQAVKSPKKSGYTVEAVAETKSSSLFLRV